MAWSEGEGSARLVPPVDESDNVRGNEKAPITLVEFADFACPFCGRAAPVVRRLLHELGGELRFVLRHNPLVDLHPTALAAAQIAEAAATVGRFWEAHDALFEAQDEEFSLNDLAARIGIAPEVLFERAQAEEVIRKIERDRASARRSGAQGTPTFFIDGRRFDQQWSLESLRAALAEARSRAAEMSGVEDLDRDERPNPGDPGPEQPVPSTPVDPAEDPRLPPQEKMPRGI